ncbi:MAG: hypothetical protein ISEC1_P1645 [Thiomicrorhabdus sp.]|nr:MAG: hypothetical protein ISEC1_P1645 [Thiomicrorhabdus sp.]
MVVKKTHHFLQYLFAVFVAYLLVTRLITSWAQYAPEQFVEAAEWASNSQVSFDKIKIQQDWLGFQFKIENLQIEHENYEIYVKSLDADVNLLSLLIPSMNYGAYLEIEGGRYYAKTSPSEEVKVTGLDLQQLTQVNLNVSRLWQRVKIEDLVLSQVLAPELTVQIYNFQSLKGAQISIASEFGLAFRNSLIYERFSLKSTLKQTVWGGVDDGEISLSSFQPLRVERVAQLLPSKWHKVLPKGDLILDMQATLSRSQISKLTLKLNSQSLSWPQKHKSLPSSLGLELVWGSQYQNFSTQLRDWHFRLAKIQLDNRYIEAVSPIELSLEGSNLLKFSTEKFDISPFKLIVQSLIPNQHIGALFDQTAELKIDHFTGQFDWKNLTLPKLQLKIKKIAIPVTNYPGLLAENITLLKDAQLISLQTNKPLWLMEPKVHIDAMRIDLPKKLEVHFSEKQQSWMIHKQPIKVDNMQLVLTAKSDTSGLVDASLSFDIGTMYKLKQYLPYSSMPINLQNWLKTALVDGRNIKGSAILKGNIENFPFTEGKGIFEVNARVEKTYIKFNPNWPTLQNFTGLIKFTPFDLTVTSDRIYLGAKAHATDVVVDIANLDTKDIALDIKGRVSTHFTRAMNYLKLSPLADALNMQGFIDSSTFGGEIDINLEKVWVPLAGFGTLPQTVSGTLQFKNANLKLLQKLSIEKINGSLAFSETAVSASKLSANVLNGPGTFSVETKPKSRQVSIKGTGKFAEIDHIYFKNVVPWRAEILVPFKAGDNQAVKTTLQIDISDSESLLPAPLDQKALAGKSLNIQAELLNDEIVINVDIPTLLNSDAILAKGASGYQVKQLRLLMGNEYKLPENSDTQGSYIKGNISQLDLDKWIDLYKTLNLGSDNPEGGQVSKQMPQLNWTVSNISIEALHAWGKAYPHVSIDWLNQQKVTTFKIKSPDISAQVVVNPTKPTEMNVDYLQLYTADNHQDESIPDDYQQGGCQASQQKRDLWPNIIFKGKNIQLNDYKVDSLNFRLTDSNEMLVISEMKGAFGSQAGSLTGQFLLDKTLYESKVALSLSSNNVAAVTRFMQIKDGFTGEKANVNVRLDWQGGLECFSKTTSKGVIDFELNDGAIEDIEPGFARLIGLLSVESLARRLKLDLKDLMNKGMAYDRIKGQAKLKDGLLNLTQFKLTAPSAKAEMSGQIDLVKESFNLKADVTPAIGASLPALAALAGYSNPLTALAVYTVMKVLPGINENLVSYEYAVTGPWLDPKIEQITKDPESSEIGILQEDSILDLQ